jgi:hypothetical protein
MAIYSNNLKYRFKTSRNNSNFVSYESILEAQNPAAITISEPEPAREPTHEPTHEPAHEPQTKVEPHTKPSKRLIKLIDPDIIISVKGIPSRIDTGLRSNKDKLTKSSDSPTLLIRKAVDTASQELPQQERKENKPLKNVNKSKKMENEKHDSGESSDQSNNNEKITSGIKKKNMLATDSVDLRNPTKVKAIVKSIEYAISEEEMAKSIESTISGKKSRLPKERNQNQNEGGITSGTSNGTRNSQCSISPRNEEEQLYCKEPPGK